MVDQQRSGAVPVVEGTEAVGNADQPVAVCGAVADLDVRHVFVFGRPWLAAARLLGLGDGSTLPVQWNTPPSRQAQVFPLNKRQSLVVTTQSGYAGPPGAADTGALATALARH